MWRVHPFIANRSTPGPRPPGGSGVTGENRQEQPVRPPGLCRQKGTEIADDKGGNRSDENRKRNRASRSVAAEARGNEVDTRARQNVDEKDHVPNGRVKNLEVG